MPRRLSRASVVRVFRPRSSVCSTGQWFQKLMTNGQRGRNLPLHRHGLL